MKAAIIFDRKFFKFILVGIINTIVGFAIMLLLYNAAHFNYWLSQKNGFHVDEGLSVTISCYNDYMWVKNYELNKEYTGKEIKEISLCDNSSLKNALGDILRLWKDNRDSPHTNLYYSFLRLSLAGIKTGDLKSIIYRGGILNLMFFSVSFVFFYLLIKLLFPDSMLLQFTATACAFLSTATISNTLFLRPYQIQETMFIAPYKTLRYVMPVFPFFIFLPVTILSSMQKPKISIAAMLLLFVLFSKEALNQNKIEYLYHNKPDMYSFSHDVSVPVFIVNKTNWKYADLIPYFNDEQIYYFLEYFSYKFDAPYMALSVLASIVSFLFMQNNIVFSFTYGNALLEQKRYNNFRTEILLHDLSMLFPNKTEEPLLVKINNSEGFAPSIQNISLHMQFSFRHTN